MATHYEENQYTHVGWLREFHNWANRGVNAASHDDHISISFSFGKGVATRIKSFLLDHLIFFHQLFERLCSIEAELQRVTLATPVKATAVSISLLVGMGANSHFFEATVGVVGREVEGKRLWSSCMKHLWSSMRLPWKRLRRSKKPSSPSVSMPCCKRKIGFNSKCIFDGM